MLTINPEHLTKDEKRLYDILEQMRAYSNSLTTSDPLPQPVVSKEEIVAARKWQASKLLPQIEALSHSVQYETQWFYNDMEPTVQDIIAKSYALALSKKNLQLTSNRIRTIFLEIEAEFVHDSQKKTYKLKPEFNLPFEQYLNFLKL